MALRIIAFVETAVSVVILIFSLRPMGEPLTATQGVLLGFVAVGFIVLAFSEAQSYRKSRPLSFKNEDEINEYMFQWISRGGRVVIFTRDMSWANKEQIKNLLVSKASRNELSIYLPKKIPLTYELEKNGAKIYSYEHLDYVPQSRFTIINKDRMDAHVAVGRRIEDRHIIEEYHMGDHHVFSVANDLVEVIKRIDKLNK